MRDILFRAKLNEKQTHNSIREETKAKFFPDGWAYGFYVPEQSETPLGEVKPIASIIKTGDSKELTTGMWFNVDSATAGQFTGLTDKNGNKIFEGDIVDIYGDEVYAVVVWDKETAKFLIIEDYEKNIATFDDYKGEDLVVVGNIHDNADMLEGDYGRFTGLH